MGTARDSETDGQPTSTADGDDSQGTTIAHASSVTAGGGSKVDAAKSVGDAVAKACIDKGVEQVVFDRNGFLYHGRVKALADGAREKGVKF